MATNARIASLNASLGVNGCGTLAGNEAIKVTNMLMRMVKNCIW
jgi:hypothetical protein